MNERKETVKKTETTTKIYAAYGSNMKLEQMKHRCPGARIIGTAIAHDYRLIFRGQDGCAIATIEPQRGSDVPVVLWEIGYRDERSLDAYEGWPSFYRKESIRVTTTKKKRAVNAMVYILNGKCLEGTPSAAYFKVIADGYKAARLDIKVLAKAVYDSIPNDISRWETPLEREVRRQKERQAL